MHYIYIIQNNINLAIYVGQTVQPKTRWRTHKNLARRKPLQYIHNAMAKHGIENFTFTVIEEWETQQEADDAEEFWIESLRSRVKGYGYNLKAGGNASCHSEETKQSLSEQKTAFYQKRLAETGSKMTPEEIQKLSDSHKGLPSPHKGWGVPHTQEWKDNNSILMKASWASGKFDGVIPALLEGGKATRFKKGQASPVKIVWSEQDKETIKSLYLSGATSYDLGKQFSKSPTTIIRLLRSLGINVKRRKKQGT